MIFLGLGSSIGDAKKIFKSVEEMLTHAGIKILKKSEIFKNPPQGGIAKNEFSNAVWKIETEIVPIRLLHLVQAIELKLGRERKKKWEDRTIDLDILIWRNQIWKEDNLEIPHPEIPNRLFVLKPLAEIVDESFEIPTFGSLKNLLERYENRRCHSRNHPKHR